MGGFDDRVSIMGDAFPPSPSPRTFFSSLMGDDSGLRSAAEPISENNSAPHVLGVQDHIISVCSEHKQDAQDDLVHDQTADSSALIERKMSNRGGLLERRAARAGFNAPRLNTETIRPPDLTQNQELRSPYLTFSPGFSPTVLLDSPVFLSNSLVQPSPTTGKFSFAASGWNPTFATDAPDKSKDNLFDGMNSSSFTFQTVEEPKLAQFQEAASRSTLHSLPQQDFPNVDQVSVHSENPRLPQNTQPSNIHPQHGAMMHRQADLPKSLTEKDTGNNIMSSEPMSFHTGCMVDQSPPLDEQQEEDVDQRAGMDTNAGGAPAEDGYNWRKYGQKQVKGSEYPRSYYKCTHPNCPVKKKVERSLEGHITEIIYKGAHNHPKPPPNRRSGLGSSPADGSEQGGMGIDGDPAWSTMQKGTGGWHDNFEVTSSAQMGSEYGNASLHQGGTQFESGDAVDGSCTFSNDDDEDDRGTGSVSLGYDGEGDESESKRRKLETYASEMSGATRAIREPRVVVQTTSEVDILDDGYRWRKYGQKVVKGNPNPRSYYKCTSAGCTVRKHVERASHDLKSVITTYEGKHNHDVPAARNSSHANSSAANSLSSQAASVVQSHIHRSDASQIHNSMARFERPPTFGSFNLPGLGTNQGFGFGMNQQGLAGISTAGLVPNQGKLPGLPGFPGHSYLGMPRSMNNDMGFMAPKEEPKLEPMSNPGLNIPSGSAVYNQIMSRLPLGPQM